MGKHFAPVFAFTILALLALFPIHAASQAALLMEEPYGFFGWLNPTGHNAIYFQNICAETPVELRQCKPGELGAVIARYQGIAGYDWVAIPLVPYLYSVETNEQVPERVNRRSVQQMRERYHEAHLLIFGEHQRAGTFLHGGWSQLVGAAYERRIFAFSFATTPEQDDALIASLNAGPNRSHFNLLYNNCADFARSILNGYFPRTFRRGFFPDAGMTTPKQLAYKLVRYARRHPGVELRVYSIEQVPGFRRMSRSAKGVAESLSTTGYAVPIVLLNPYIAGGLFVDYLMQSHRHAIPRDVERLDAGTLSALTRSSRAPENQPSASSQTNGVAALIPVDSQETGAAKIGLKETKCQHE